MIKGFWQNDFSLYNFFERGTFMTVQPFEVLEPIRLTTSVLFASPHSGQNYQDAFGDEVQLTRPVLRSSEDAFVDRLFDYVPALGATMLCATFPRAYVDLNRSSDELDPALIEGIRRVSHNPRVVSGLGVIPRVVSGGRAIYCGKLPMAEAKRRLAMIWHPYHEKLQELMDRNSALFGESILIDCHSMPHEALECSRQTGSTPEIVIGDRFGASASQRLVQQIAAAFRDEGLTVAHNTPFAGAFSTVTYGRPSRRQHAIQIEIDRSLYMDEATLTPHADFPDFRAMLRRVSTKIAALGEREMPLAAE